MSRYITNLAGLSFRPAEAKDCVQLLRRGFQLEIEREPENPHDANAIKVFANVKYDSAVPVETPDESTERMFIGYVEKMVNPRLAAELDSGAQWIANVDKTYDDYAEPVRSGMWAKPLIEIMTSDNPAAA